MSLISIYTNGRITFIGTDPYYHIRRIVYTAQHFPDTITFDSYLNYPFGFDIGWPPLYDRTIAYIALILGNGNPDINTIETVAALFPAILGALTIIPLYYAASTLFDKRTAILSAAIISLIPAHLMVSEAGVTDHHVAEVFLSTTAYAFLIISLKYGQKLKLTFSGIKDENFITILKPFLLSIATGATLALAMLTWLGAPIFLGLIGIYAFVQFTFDLKEKRNSEYLLINIAITYITAAVLILPAISRTIGTGQEISGMFLSDFHVIFIVLMLLATLLSGLLASVFRTKGILWKYYPAAIISIFLLGTIIVAVISPGFYQQLLEGIRYLSGNTGILGTINEALPLFFDERFTFKYAWDGFTIFNLTALAGILITLKDTIEKKYNSEMVFFFVWTAVVLLLAILQRRFVYILSINFAILSGYSISILYELWKKDQEQNKKSKKTSSKTPIWQKYANIGIILVFISIVSIGFFSPVVGTLFNPPVPSSDWQESLEWLGSNSPETSYYPAPDETPEYGVLSWWDYGNWILYIAKRPVVANNFQTGVEDSALFFVTSDESEAVDILEKRNVRYVITDTLTATGKFRHMFDIVGDDSLQGKSFDEFSRGEDIQKTTLIKLHIFDGSQLDNLRLIHESESSDLKIRFDSESEDYTEIKNVKIFEYVPAANIYGYATPNQMVDARTNVTLSNGRTFEYENSVIANDSGWYELKVPYSTIDTPYGSRADTYRITVHGDEGTAKELRIDEEDVMEGRKLQVDLVPHSLQ